MKGRSPFKNSISPSPLKERGIKGVRLIILINLLVQVKLACYNEASLLKLAMDEQKI